MEYSKDIILNTKNAEVKKVKNNLYKQRTSHGRIYKMLAMFSLICIVLIGVDMVLILKFANILQSIQF